MEYRNSNSFDCFPKRETVKRKMEGLIQEGAEIMEDYEEDAMRDAGFNII